MSLLPREQAHAVTAPAPRFDPHERPHGARDSRAYRAREAVHQHPEIDCVRSLLSPGIAEAAEHRADRIGVGADRVLIAAGSLSEDRYVTALAAHLGIPFEPLETVPRHACMLSDERLPAAAAAGLLPLRLSSDFVWVVAPRGVAARRLIGLVRLHPVLRERLRLTTAARITRFANQHGSRSVGLLAADGLRTAKPQFSAATRSRFHPLLLAAAAIGICAAIAPAISVAVLDAALATLFLGWIFMRFAAAALRVKPTRVEPVNDQSLPTYTIIVALYREARAVPGLVHALKQLDYPAEKLDIKFVIEPDDRETKEAFARARLGPPFEIIVAPRFGPRTKPKALNAALPFARGAYTVIYDAEDRPEPDQLRQAIGLFRSETEHLACVQARLTIDNTADSLLTRLFTAEYAGLFDVFLPGLADRDLPLPLGGSSNHFRTDILRAIGAWDPYNVTEDADLGMRLARFGYHSHVIRSTTYEEAPARLTPWIKQRTRWFKGWMQTYLVHMRAPRALKRDLGWSGFIIFQLVVGGAVLSALVHPIFVAALAMNIIDGSFLSSNASPTEFALDVLHLVTLMASYLASGFLGALGLMRRKLLSSVWVLGFMPIHWMLLSIAAWRAIFQLIINPFHWEKTEHGLARTSRRVTPGRIKYGAEDPRRLRQASVSN